MTTRRAKLGSPDFNDIIDEMYALTLKGIPGTTDFYFDFMYREMIALAIAIYYQCDHCRLYHGKALEEGSLIKPARISEAAWNWRKDIYKIVLFLRTDSRLVSAPEWEVWQEAWQHFAVNIAHAYPKLPCAIVLAIGIARDDEALMNIAIDSLKARVPDASELGRLVEEVHMLTLFMKLATSKNRVEPFLKKKLRESGLSI